MFFRLLLTVLLLAGGVVENEVRDAAVQRFVETERFVAAPDGAGRPDEDG